MLLATALTVALAAVAFDHAELRERLEVERVRVVDRRVDLAKLLPGELVGPGAAAKRRPFAEGVEGWLAYTADGPIRLRNLQYARDRRPLEEDCPCAACHHSRGYLRHLFQAGEMLGAEALVYLQTDAQPVSANVRSDSAGASGRQIIRDLRSGRAPPASSGGRALPHAGIVRKAAAARAAATLRCLTRTSVWFRGSVLPTPPAR